MKFKFFPGGNQALVLQMPKNKKDWDTLSIAPQSSKKSISSIPWTQEQFHDFHNSRIES